jgi:arylformamidase
MYYDISLPIRDGMLSWPSDPDVAITPYKTIDENGSNLVKLETGNHFGTHVDAPKHNLARGMAIDEFPPDVFMGPVHVLDFTDLDGIDILVRHLEERVPDGIERIIFKTRNTTDRLLQRPFDEKYVALSGEGAEWLAALGVKLVGIDYLSIQRRGSDGRAHTALLERDIPIIEGLWLVDVAAGEYELLALPLRIEHGDGAPARVFLRK